MFIVKIKKVSTNDNMEGLKSYCEQTSLHGWYYISVHGGKTAWRIVWTAIVLTSIGVASLFIYKAAEDFTKSTVVTTIHSTTEPLSEVYFPAVTVCNINQVPNFVKQTVTLEGCCAKIKLQLFN